MRKVNFCSGNVHNEILCHLAIDFSEVKLCAWKNLPLVSIKKYVFIFANIYHLFSMAKLTHYSYFLEILIQICTSHSLYVFFRLSKIMWNGVTNVNMLYGIQRINFRFSHFGEANAQKNSFCPTNKLHFIYWTSLTIFWVISKFTHNKVRIIL